MIETIGGITPGQWRKLLTLAGGFLGAKVLIWFIFGLLLVLRG